MKQYKLILPKNYSVELAEETGIHIGDGGMGLCKSKNKNHWYYVYAFHSEDDKEYSEYVKNLINKLYNLYPYERRQGNCGSFVYTRKNLVLFKKELDLPMGKKENIKIPLWILSNKKFELACVRGIFDTDGSITIQKKYKKFPYYPHVKITSKSYELVSQIKGIFSEFGIKSSISRSKRITARNPNIIFNVDIYGSREVGRFFQLFGSSNPKHAEKYENWKKNGGIEI